MKCQLMELELLDASDDFQLFAETAKERAKRERREAEQTERLRQDRIKEQHKQAENLI